jgi:peptidoglycan/LPS O-acetylase OafA/YrhL
MALTARRRGAIGCQTALRSGKASLLRNVPGLDGLRGVAVLAVMAFHAGVATAGGGLLGVDVFFVLSGFLVTCLLLAEYQRNRTIRLRSFWARRARRLLPALFVLLAGIIAYARWGSSGISPVQLKGDALATLFYGANWHYIATGQNYFVKYGAPSPLLHTWSLGVEEQFYLAWPLIALVVLRRFGTAGLRWAAGLLAAASAATCASLYLAGTSVDSLYYSTDTRAQSLMVGALLAVLIPTAWRQEGAATPVGSSHRTRWAVTLGGAGYLGAGVLLYSLHAAHGDGPFLYEGGFLVVAGATTLLVAVTVVRPPSVLNRALSMRPLRYTGRISYGLYLYHWPLFLVLNGARTGLGGYALTAVRFGATVAVAAVSYHLIENPVRTGRWPANVNLGHFRKGSMAWLSLLTASLILIGVLVEFGVPTGTQRIAVAAASTPPPAYAAPGGASSVNLHSLLIGDSLALTLGEGLSRDAEAWGVSVDNQGTIGCDLDPQTVVNVMGTVSQTAQGCPHWRATWAQIVARTDPDVVVLLLGRWESLDRKYDGQWTHVGESEFDQHLQGELTEVINICAARGAKVVLLTLPYIAQTTEQPDGSPWDMNLPTRTDAYNSDVRAVVAREPTKASVIDLNSLLDPGGRYVSSIDGIRVRDADGEHLSFAGGEWLRPYLLPRLAGLGTAHFRARLKSPPAS